MADIALTKTTAGRNLLRDSAKGTNVSTVKYFAVGTGSTTPTAGDTRLVAEAYRKAITSNTNDGDGSVLIDVYLGPTDAVGINIAEVGIFAGNSANSNANTGTLIARGLFPHGAKSQLESILLRLDLSFT